jgi:hypothetical protein
MPTKTTPGLGIVQKSQESICSFLVLFLFFSF